MKTDTYQMRRNIDRPKLGSTADVLDAMGTLQVFEDRETGIYLWLAKRVGTAESNNPDAHNEI